MKKKAQQNYESEPWAGKQCRGEEKTISEEEAPLSLVLFFFFLLTFLVPFFKKKQGEGKE